MREFAYVRPRTLADARVASAAPGVALLAGGRSLLRDMKRGRVEHAGLVDLASLVPDRIEADADALSLGAGVRHAAVAASALVRSRLAVLADLVGHIGDPAVRHRGTMGGALAAYEPAGDYPAACLALDAVISTTDRMVSAEAFFAGDGRTSLAGGEIVTGATFRIPHRAAYVKILNPAARYAMVGVFVAVDAAGRTRVAVTGASANGAFRWRAAEAALDVSFASKAVVGVPLPVLTFATDLFADASYRAHLTGVLCGRAVALAAGPPPHVLVISHGSEGSDRAR